MSKRIIIFVATILLALSAYLLFSYIATPQERKSDYNRISSETYDTVFLSMFPINNYNEDDYSHYRAQTILKTSYVLPDLNTLEAYLKEIAKSGNSISTVYLGVRPEQIDENRLYDILAAYPSVNYHIILPYPSSDYWRSLSQEKLQQHLDQYRQLTDKLLPESNMSLYLFAKEWLICNPHNYESTFLTTWEISRTLMTNCDREHKYVITHVNIESVFTEFSQLVQQVHSETPAYADLSSYKIVFLGDSIIGNYTNSASIPGVLRGLTDASVFNCGLSGATAAYYSDPDCPITLTDTVNALVSKDTSALPTDKQVYLGVSEYIASLSESPDSSPLYFIINYGTNDYFKGLPITTEDPLDTQSYSGALRYAIEKLQQAYPHAQIILMTPFFTSYFNNGEDSNSEVGGTLKDYVNTVLSVGREYNLRVLNNYEELNIDTENYWTYLVDGCHPNETTRFLIGERITRLLTNE